jgi:hypothetical protein
MRRANDKEADNNSNESGTSSTKGGGRAGGVGSTAAGGRFLSFSETIWTVLTNPRRNVGFFLVLAAMTFCFYMTSYSSPSTSSSTRETDEGGGGLKKTSSSQLRHGNTKNRIPGSVSGTAQDPCTIWLAPSSLKGNPGVSCCFLCSAENMSNNAVVAFACSRCCAFPVSLTLVSKYNPVVFVSQYGEYKSCESFNENAGHFFHRGTMLFYVHDPFCSSSLYSFVVFLLPLW